MPIFNTHLYWQITQVQYVVTAIPMFFLQFFNFFYYSYHQAQNFFHNLSMLSLILLSFSPPSITITCYFWCFNPLENTVQNAPVPVRQRRARSVENISAAEASVEEIPNVSLTRRSQALGIAVTSLLRILRWSWPTSLQNQIDARTESAWPPDASYVCELGLKWFEFLSKNHLQRWGSFLAEWLHQ